MLDYLRTPDVLPSSVRGVYASVPVGADPGDVVWACARQAVARLGISDPTWLRRRVDGFPRWPLCVRGAITHTDRVAAAAVAWSSDAHAIGIDTRPVGQHAPGREQMGVAWPVEVAHGTAAGLHRLEAFALVLAAKRAVFKSMGPRHGTFPRFFDLRLVRVDANNRVFVVRAVQPLSAEIPVGLELEGRFDIDAAGVHAAVKLNLEGRW